MSRVLLVEDHASFRQAMSLVFGDAPDFGPVSEAGTIAEARRAKASGFDLAVVDLGLPDGDATALIQSFKEISPPPTVLVLTASLDRERHALAIEAGADGILHKAAEIDDILASARRLLAGENILSAEETVEMLRLATRKRSRDGEARLAARSLTRREREVLQALAEGLSKKEIAKKLNIAVETEHTHMTNIFDKLGVHSRLEAFLFAVRQGRGGDQRAASRKRAEGGLTADYGRVEPSIVRASENTSPERPRPPTGVSLRGGSTS
ncbi:MAG: response regulator transcription factor [Rubrobacter sp.]|nr:response regulator transcription factor [Rubrobacter sp.]